MTADHKDRVDARVAINDWLTTVGYREDRKGSSVSLYSEDVAKLTDAVLKALDAQYAHAQMEMGKLELKLALQASLAQNTAYDLSVALRDLNTLSQRNEYLERLLDKHVPRETIKPLQYGKSPSQAAMEHLDFIQELQRKVGPLYSPPLLSPRGNTP